MDFLAEFSVDFLADFLADSSADFCMDLVGIAGGFSLKTFLNPVKQRA